MRVLPTSGAASSALSATVLAGFALITLTAVLAGCASAPNVMVDRDSAVDLKQYRTFGYYDTTATDASRYSTLLTSHLKRATRAQLERHGYAYADVDPDLRVDFFLDVADKQELRSRPSTGRFGYRSWAGASYDLVEYRQGTLRIDLVDAKRNALVWQGIARDRIDEKSAQNPGPALDAVVGEIFTRYPNAPTK